MKRIKWFTDIHLNFLKEPQLKLFWETLQDFDNESILISGDIGEADSIIEYLEIISSKVKGQVYFVLGNHDFYKGSISKVRSEVRNLCSELQNLTWLTDVDIIHLTPTIGLFGHDSWADGRYGNYWDSNLILSDYLLIKEFNPWLIDTKKTNDALSEKVQEELMNLTSLEAKQKRLDTLQFLASQAVDHLSKIFARGFDEYEQLIFLTHVPPFQEVCLNEGTISDEFGLPHFSCKAVGDLLISTFEKYPDSNLIVLCGHTHSKATSQILPNLKVYCGESEYGFPMLQSVIDLK